MGKNDITLYDRRTIGIDHPPYFIAEIGINHNGEYDKAIKLIDIAEDAGVDAIKFQKRNFINTIHPCLLNTDYSHKNSFGKTYKKHKEFLEFSNEEFIELAKYTNNKDLDFSCSAFDIESYDFIEKFLSPPFHKIPSPLTVNHKLLIHVLNYNKPTFISTGMTSLDEIDSMMKIITKINNQIVLLQCTSLYPTEDHEVNLNVIKLFQERYGVLVGFSSHDKSVFLPSVAVGLGARVIEKHITLDRTLPGPDHVSSFEPRGLALSYKYIMSTYNALGKKNKTVLTREKEVRKKHMQGITANIDINQGDILTERMIGFKSPANGILPYEMDKILGKKAKSNISIDDYLKLEDFE